MYIHIYLDQESDAAKVPKRSCSVTPMEPIARRRWIWFPDRSAAKVSVLDLSLSGGSEKHRERKYIEREKKIWKILLRRESI